MTTPQKRGVGVAIGSVSLVALAGVLGLWPQVQPIAEWVIDNLRIVLMRPQVEAVLLSIGAGVALTLGLPWLAAWNEFTPEATRARLRWYSGGLSFAVAWYLAPTRVGFVYAVLTGLAGTQVGMSVLRILQTLLPYRAQPQSLIDSSKGPGPGE